MTYVSVGGFVHSLCEKSGLAVEPNDGHWKICSMKFEDQQTLAPIRRDAPAGEGVEGG